MKDRSKKRGDNGGGLVFRVDGCREGLLRMAASYIYIYVYIYSIYRMFNYGYAKRRSVGAALDISFLFPVVFYRCSWPLFSYNVSLSVGN